MQLASTQKYNKLKKKMHLNDLKTFCCYLRPQGAAGYYDFKRRKLYITATSQNCLITTPRYDNYFVSYLVITNHNFELSRLRLLPQCIMDVYAKHTHLLSTILTFITSFLMYILLMCSPLIWMHCDSLSLTSFLSQRKSCKQWVSLEILCIIHETKPKSDYNICFSALCSMSSSAESSFI